MPDEQRARYERLRQIAFGCTIKRAKLDPKAFADDRVFGGVMEFTVGTQVAMLFCCLEQGAGQYVHVALYTSSGFAIIGENFPASVFDSARTFLSQLNDWATKMNSAIDFGLPRKDRTRFYAFTRSATLMLESKPGFLGAPSAAKPLEIAGHTLLRGMQKVADGTYYEEDRRRRFAVVDADGCIAESSALIASEGQSAAKVAEALVRRGVALMAKNDLRGAVEDFSSAIAHGREALQAYYYRGRCRADLGDLDAALEDSKAAVIRAPFDPYALFFRGLMLIRSGDSEAAQGDFEKALKLKPDFADAYFERGILRFQGGDIKGAIADYDKCLQFDPSIHEALVSRGNAYNRIGDFKRALEDLDAAVAKHPDWPIALSNRGNARLGLSRFKDAVEDYDASLAIRSDAKTLANRGVAKLRLSDLIEAERDLTVAIQLEPLAAMFADRALIHQARGQLADAMSDFDECIALGPVRAAYLSGRAALKRKMGDEAGAAADEKSATLLGADHEAGEAPGAYVLDETELRHD